MKITKYQDFKLGQRYDEHNFADNEIVYQWVITDIREEHITFHDINSEDNHTINIVSLQKYLDRSEYTMMTPHIDYKPLDDDLFVL